MGVLRAAEPIFSSVLSRFFTDCLHTFRHLNLLIKIRFSLFETYLFVVTVRAVNMFTDSFLTFRKVFLFDFIVYFFIFFFAKDIFAIIYTHNLVASATFGKFICIFDLFYEALFVKFMAAL